MRTRTAVRKRRQALGAFLFLFLVAAGCSVVPEEGDFQGGLEAYSQGDYDAAMKKWRPLAENGNPHAQVNLGVMYYEGRGVRQDYEEALRWYKMAAMQGYAEGQYNLGVAYAQGKGVQQDLREAQRWYRQAAEQGYAPAQLLLAEMYYRGQATAVNYEEAAKWYRAAAEQADPMAQYILGGLYLTGPGVERDLAQAYLWLSLAAQYSNHAVVRQNSLRMKEMVAKGMTPTQLQESEERVKNWRPKNASEKTP